MEFYSSREERLKRSPKKVQDFNTRIKSKNIFVRNPQLKVIFLDIIIIVVFAIIIFPLIQRLGSSVNTDNFKIEPKAFVFEEKLLISLKLTPRKKNKLVGTESLNIDILTIDGIVIASKTDEIFDYNKKRKDISFKLDDRPEIEKINIVIKSENETKEFKIDIDR